MIPATNIACLKHVGWTAWDIGELGQNEFAQRLVDFAKVLGEPVVSRSMSIFEHLSPAPPSASHRNTLSKAHGLGEFPLHIDTSHWPTPARYILIGCKRPGSGNRPTLLLQFDEIGFTAKIRESLNTAPFRIVNGRQSFFSTVTACGRQFIRLDHGCMVPTSKSSADVFRFFLQPSVLTKSFEWKTGRVLVIDNWRVLHGRGAASVPDTDRLLIRIAIK